MNYFELYPGDYLRDTTRLTLVEHGAYLRLLMTYYAEEEALPAGFDQLFTIAGATKPAEKEAVKRVAEKFFPVGSDGLRHNSRADEEIAKAAGRMVDADERRSNDAERKRRSRERRSQLFAQLREFGVVPHYDATMAELEAELSRCMDATGHSDTRDKNCDGHKKVTRDGTATTRHTPHATTALATPSQAQNHLASATPAGRACLLMREAGCTQTNPAHPDLLAALAEGVTPEALAATVREAVEARKPKPFAWAIATARGRHAEGAKPITGGSHAPNPRGAARESAAERVARINAEPGETLEGEFRDVG